MPTRWIHALTGNIATLERLGRRWFVRSGGHTSGIYSTRREAEAVLHRAGFRAPVRIALRGAA